MAPFFALKYAPKAMGKLCLGKGDYPNSSEKGTAYGSIIVVGSVAGTYGGEYMAKVEDVEEVLGTVTDVREQAVGDHASPWLVMRLLELLELALQCSKVYRETQMSEGNAYSNFR